MNNYTFNADGKQYKRIDKRQAKKLYDAGKTIILCACNLRPFGFWRPEIPINKTDYLKHGYTAPASDYDFRHRVNSFEFYNCTNTETGKYCAFYTEL